MGDIRTLGVVGGGLMGAGIAQVAAQAGLATIVCEVDAAASQRSERSIHASLDRAVARGKLSADLGDMARARLTFTTNHAVLVSCGLVIEAVAEDLAVKLELWRSLDVILPADVIFASNTSSLSIAEQAGVTGRPDRFCGMHFFNPVPAMRLVEVVRSEATSAATLDTALALARRLDKVPIVARDTPGFVVNLLLVPYMLDAVRAAERGVASVEDIDLGMRLGAGHPAGPLALCDIVGIDTLGRVATILHDAYAESRFAPPPLLRRMVAGGRLGRKSRVGFYDWSVDPPAPVGLLT